jgi:Spy/CpxP family protein refolding chaperone
MTSTTCRTWMVAIVLLLGARTTFACGGTSGSTQPPVVAASPSGATDDEASEGLMEHHRYHHHGGVTLFIAMSLDTLGVSPEQHAAVEKTRADLYARMEQSRTAEQNLMSTLADGLAAASFDTTKVDAAVAQVAAAAAAAHDASTDALNELHAELTPPQRAALVDKVEAHWAVSQKANAEETGPVSPEGGHLANLSTELGLTADQVNRIRASLGEGMKAVPRLDSQEIAAHLRAFGDAFRGDAFDAKALTTASGANAHLASWGAAHMAHFVETVSPVLTPDQRVALAQRLREHANHDPSAPVTP